MLEPISPELVLVDPELRRELQARALQGLRLQAIAELRPSPQIAEPAPKPAELEEVRPARQPVAAVALPEPPRHDGQPSSKPRRRRLVPALLSVSLAVNAIVIALSVSDARIAQTSPTPPLAIDTTTSKKLAPTVPVTKPPSSKKRTGAKKPAPRPAVAHETRRAVEQKVLNLVIQSPAGKLPGRLINSTTGLAKNGLQALCRRSSDSRSFLCVIQPRRHKAGEGLYVRYRPARKGPSAFTWYPYQSG
jgi:hypothetical protein